MVMCLFVPMNVRAQEDIIEQFDFTEIENVIEDIFPEEKMSFSDFISKIVNGETFMWNEVLEFIWKQITYEFQSARKSLIHILLIAIIAAIFHNFSGVFQNQHVAELSFYILYMLMMAICLNVFQLLMKSVEVGVSQLLDFFRALGPVYFMSVAITTGSGTSIVFYNIMLFVIYLVELLITQILLPLVQMFFVIQMLNHMSKEEYLSKFGELLQIIIKWSLRTLLAAIVGFIVVPGMLTPAIDSVKRRAMLGSGEAIPFIGDVIGGTADVFLGTAVLIRNGIGIAGMLISLGICIAPIVQMAVIVLAYRLAAAVMQPISEKRIIGSMESMSESANLLLQIIITVCALFLIVIAIIANTT